MDRDSERSNEIRRERREERSESTCKCLQYSVKQEGARKGRRNVIKIKKKHRKE